MVPGLPVAGQPPNFEQRGRVLRADLETRAETPAAESSHRSSAAPTAADKDFSEPQQPRACSRARRQMETPAGEAEGAQPQDP